MCVWQAGHLYAIYTVTPNKTEKQFFGFQLICSSMCTVYSKLLYKHIILCL